MNRTLKDFSRAQIYKIASEYATSPYYITASYFCQMYNIKEGVFRNILKKAIVESVIPETQIEFMVDKSAKNAYEHGGEGGRQLTIRNYNWYKYQRSIFKFNNKLTIQYAENYAKSPLSLTEYAKLNYMTKELLSSTLKRAIEEKLINEETIAALNLKEVKYPLSE